MAISLHALVRASDNFIKSEALQDDGNLPAVKSGWAWLPVVKINIDNSTLPPRYTVTEKVDTFPGSQVTRTITIRDMNGTELDNIKSQQVSDADLSLAEGLRLALNGLFLTINTERANRIPPDPPLTLAQFRTTLEGLSDIDRQGFIDWLKTLI